MHLINSKPSDNYVCVLAELKSKKAVENLEVFCVTICSSFFAFLRRIRTSSLRVYDIFDFMKLIEKKRRHSTIQMGNYTCSTSTEILFFISFGVIGVLIFTGNLFACVVFLTTEKLRRSKMNVFLVSLATWDILMSVLVVPFYAVYCGRGCEYSLRSYCWLMRGAKDCVKIGTTLNLYAITYDRYNAVLRPLQYGSTITPKRVTSMLAVVWCLPMILASIRNFWQHNGSDSRFANKLYDSIIVLGFVVLLVVLMLITNVKIMRAIRKQADREKRDFQLSRQMRKGTFACVVVVLVFVFCWLPRAVYNFSYIVNPPGLASPLFFRICFLSLFIQSSLNPLIYWFYRAEFRRAAFRLLRCQCVVKRAESVLSAFRTVSFLSDTAPQVQGEAGFAGPTCFGDGSGKSHSKPSVYLTSYKMTAQQ